MTDELVNIDASEFQGPLLHLAETVAQKVLREAQAHLNAPPFATVDLFVLMRQAIYTVRLLFYINADDRRETDTGWSPAFTFVTMPLVRSVIDSLYNITFILQNPRQNAIAFRRSGYRKKLSDLDEDAKRYGGIVEWDQYIAHSRKQIDFSIRADDLKMADILAERPWRTLGKYVTELGPGGTLIPHQQFLKTFTYGIWREYSAIAHGGFEGLLDVALYFTQDAQKLEIRDKMEERFPQLMSLHIVRAALLLLCIVTELQAYFRFQGANINARIHKVWKPLMPAFEARELHRERYKQLMESHGIHP